jgi:hypothetical protein
MKFCENAIRQLIATELGHDRVYPLRAPQNATTPFVVFQRTSSERWRSINNPSGIAQAIIQIDVYDSTLESAKDIGGEIEILLDGYRGLVYYGSNSPQDFVEIAGISLQSDVDLLDQTEEPFLYRNSADYLVTYKQ